MLLKTSFPGSQPLRAVVAIPARDEADRIIPCLLALAQQRGPGERPLPSGSFGVVLLVNNTSDGTAAAARALEPRLPFPLRVLDEHLPPPRAHVGWARRLALDAAADWAEAAGALAILGTDADGRAEPGWVSALLAALEGGADAVAGTFVADPEEEARFLPPATRARYAQEEHYARLVDRLAALLDPDPHDPWPRHDTHSGASFGLTVAAYRRLNGMRPVNVCEDRQLFTDLRAQDARIRHVLDAAVQVSCRLEGRATGGWGETTRARIERPEAFVDVRLERLPDALHRITARARTRVLWQAVRDAEPVPMVLADRVARQLGLRREALIGQLFQRVFGACWAALEVMSPGLVHRRFPPDRLAAEIRAAERRLARELQRARSAPRRIPAGNLLAAD
ncbi:glycosyltransferase [Roseomonas sp. BN140053]|uniref:glycosyltransferase n=1 Tax=Roseomonas sp. BN140053 TaxID=3391898 RepID=UPI0039E8D33E